MNLTVATLSPWAVVAIACFFLWRQDRRHRKALTVQANRTSLALQRARIASQRAALAQNEVALAARPTGEVEQLIRLKSFSVMAGGVGHDYANHLAAIMGHLTLAQLTEGLPAQAGVHLAEVERAVKRARDLTQQLLVYARCDTPEKHVVELPIVIGDAIASALHDAPGVVTEFNVPDDLWPVESDAGQLAQVFNILVVNAIHAMAEKSGALRIVAGNLATDGEPASRFSSRTVHIRIIDTGRGLPPTDLPKIFDPFSPANHGSSALALATVFYAIKQNGGHIDVESTVGVGTTFHLYLPAHLGANTPPVPSLTPAREPDIARNSG